VELQKLGGSDVELQKLAGKVGHLTAENYYPFNISGSEVYGITCVVVVASVTAGITALNPAVATLQHSWDGDTWNAVPGAELYNATSIGTATQIVVAGTYVLTPTATSGKIAPRCRVKVVVPTGDSIEVSQFSRTRLGTEESYGITAATDIPVYIPTAQTLVQNALVKAAYDTIIPVFNVLTDVYTYKIGGPAGTIVATLTITYSDATKDVMTLVGVA